MRCFHLNLTTISNRKNSKLLLILSISLMSALVITLDSKPLSTMALLSFNNSISASSTSIHKEKVTFTTLLTDLSQKGRWETLMNKAVQELRARHPDKDINI